MLLLLLIMLKIRSFDEYVPDARRSSLRPLVTGLAKKMKS
jgi:hypothetical protein